MKKHFALVTGASQGIGLAICKALAKRKHNLIMVSLPEPPLAQLAVDFKMNFGVDIYTYETDLTCIENCKKLYDTIKEKGYIVDILVNNAGIGSIGQFTAFPIEFYMKQMTINCQTPVYLCRLFIPDMLQLPVAHILNIGSLGAFFYMPHKEVYVASKAFIVSFTKSLVVSLKNTSVKVSLVCPGSIDSNHRMKAIHKELKGIAKWSVLHPESVAEKAILAMFKGKRFYIPGLINQYFYWLNRLLPECVQRYFVDREMCRQEKIKMNAS